MHRKKVRRVLCGDNAVHPYGRYDSAQARIGAEIYLYPNPAGEIVTVVASGLITKVELLNTLGQLVFEKTVSVAELIIPLTNFAPGVYYVKVYEGEFMGIYKLEKK